MNGSGDDSGAQPPLKRKAWTYAAGPRAGLALLRQGADGRRQFVRSRVTEPLADGFQLLLFGLFHLLPAGLVSDIGAFLGRFLVPRTHKVALRRTYDTLKTLRPDADEATLQRWLTEYMESQGRQQAEYAVVQRLARAPGGIRCIGTETLKARCDGRPVIFIGLHTSNWEVMDQYLVDLGLPLTLNYDPPKKRSHHWIVRHVRQRGGLGLFPPGRAAVRPALRQLEQNGSILIFCDEGVDRQLRAPFFGRPPHLKGNYALVARLARKTGALLWPVYLTRDGGTRFTLTALAPFTLPPGEADTAQLLQDVQQINAVLEPVIRQHLPQWFFINNRLPPE